MQTKHTPGPWHRNIKPASHYPVIFAGRNQHVLSISRQKTEEETEANLMLAQAAPDLLAALRIALHVMGSEARDSKYDNAKNMARAAITKAEGAI